MNKSTIHGKIYEIRDYIIFHYKYYIFLLPRINKIQYCTPKLQQIEKLNHDSVMITNKRINDKTICSFIVVNKNNNKHENSTFLHSLDQHYAVCAYPHYFLHANPCCMGSCRMKFTKLICFQINLQNQTEKKRKYVII